MKYYVTLKNKTYEVEVEDGEAVLLSEHENEPQAAPTVRAAVGNKEVRKPTAAATPVSVPAPIKETAVSVPSAPVAAPSPAAAEAGAVLSPMPGGILDIRVSEGDSVREGDVVMILEAMKMENEIVAPCGGTVRKLLVTKGQSVQTGTPLAVIG